MLSKSKLRRLKEEFEKLGCTQEEVAKCIGTTRPTLHKIYSGEKYDRAMVLKLIELRNAKRKEKEDEVKQLEAAI